MNTGIVGTAVVTFLRIRRDSDWMIFHLREYKREGISPVFEEDIYEAISLKTCVEKLIQR